MAVYECQVSDELVDLSRADGLFLRPTAIINISVQLPPLNAPSQSISSGTVKDKLMALINQGQASLVSIKGRPVGWRRYRGGFGSLCWLIEMQKLPQKSKPEPRLAPHEIYWAQHRAR